VCKNFQGLVQKLLRASGAEFEFIPAILCSRCSARQDRHTVSGLWQDGHKIIYCAACGQPIDISNMSDPKTLGAEHIQSLQDQQLKVSLHTIYQMTITRIKNIAREKGQTAPTCFISYSRGNRKHEKWVMELTRHLRDAEVDVTLDLTDNDQIGRSISRFITQLANVKYVMVIGTPHYQKKNENSVSPRGSIVAAEVDMINTRLTGTEEDKNTVLPLLLEGDDKASLPILLQGRIYSDFREDRMYYVNLLGLVLTLYGISSCDPLIAELQQFMLDTALRN
jgi:hypothetical protein